MSRQRSLSILVCFSFLLNLFFLASGAMYLFYVRNHGGTASFLERFSAPSPLTLNQTTDSVVRRSLFKTFKMYSVDSPTVFVGDSITEFCELDELLGTPVLNRGISSDTTVDVLDRLDDVLALHPKAIYLMIGSNDAAQRSTVADAAGRYQQILQRIRSASPATRIYMQSVLPILATSSMIQRMGPNRVAQLNPWIREMNRRISAYADNQSIFYIDIHDDFAENNELAPRYTVDGVHLSGPGYMVWKQRILPYLSRP
jgi:lysophospholipase L1-like esterase